MPVPAVAIAALVLAIGALPPGAARAAPPRNLNVTQSARVLTATWQLPAGWGTGFLEFADSPATDSEGFFSDPSVSFIEFDNESTSYTSPVQLEPGTYFVHVSAYDEDKCKTFVEPDCVDEFTDPVQITILPDPAPRAPPPAPVDRFTARPALKARAVQHARKLRVSARMNEAGTLTARGRVRVGGRTFWFKRASSKALPGLPVKLELRLSRRALTFVRRALRRHRKLNAKVTVTARDKAGNVKTARRIVGLTL